MLIMMLKKIRKNFQTGLYEAIEASYKYEFDQEALDKINVFMKDKHYLLIADWYRSLSDQEKKLVKRSNSFD